MKNWLLKLFKFEAKTKLGGVIFFFPKSTRKFLFFMKKRKRVAIQEEEEVSEFEPPCKKRKLDNEVESEEEGEDVIIVRVNKLVQNEKEVEILPPPKEDEETDDICQICWRDINLYTSCKLSCKHGPFHYCCIKKWAIKEKKPCPVCRRKIDKAYLQIGSKEKEIRIEIPRQRLQSVSFQEVNKRQRREQQRQQRDNQILYSEQRISQGDSESEARRRRLIRILEKNIREKKNKRNELVSSLYRGILKKQLRNASVRIGDVTI